MDLTPELSVIEGAYLRDLLAQPPALADTLAGLRAAPPWEIRAASYAKIVLTGMGSSLHALHPLQLRLVRAGHTAMRVETAELIHAQADLLDDRTLLVVVSQSGRSAETVQLLELLQAREKRPFVIGVTNTPGSPLASSADAVVWMRAGQEFSVSCKTSLRPLGHWPPARILSPDCHVTRNKPGRAPVSASAAAPPL